MGVADYGITLLESKVKGFIILFNHPHSREARTRRDGGQYSHTWGTHTSMRPMCARKKWRENTQLR